METVQKFFLFCSGASNSILNRTPIEINRYVGIGATIFFTGVFAFFAGSYALYSVFHSIPAAVIFGLVWALMIFNLDRFIVSTMRKNGRFFSDTAMVLPRIALALLIAVVIAKPLELKIFQSEIEAELVLMKQENKIQQESLVKSRFNDDIESWQSEIVALKEEITERKNYHDKLVQDALIEADGSGGSKIRNMGPIYAAKKLESERVANDLQSLTQNNEQEMLRLQQLVDQKNLELNNELTALEFSSLDGFAAQLTALHRVSNKNQAIYIASLFIMILFVAIELAPILVKLISERSPYDYVINKHELMYQMNHKYFSEKLRAETSNKLKFELSTEEYKTDLAIKTENELAKKELEEYLRDKTQPLQWMDLFRKGKLLKTD